MPTTADPRMLRIQLGIELRRLREEADRSTFEAADVLGCKQPKMSKIEGGSQGIKPEEVVQLLDFYGAPAKQRRYLADVAEQAAKRNRPKKYHRDAVPDWFQRFLALESAATEIRLYEMETITGLLQTADYARSTIQAWEPAADPRLIEQQVRTRMQRQVVLKSKSRLRSLDVVLSEAALRRVQGSSEIMQAQLSHLLELSERPSVAIRVLPFTAPNRITVLSSFILLHLGAQQLSSVYLEDVLGATYLWEPDEYTRYSMTLDRLQAAALPIEESRDLIAKVRSAHI
ncbi:helix-turn-helix transcriptional regulator [Saccharopolyspora sp. NFXS83]|uniref:helix-turn-helix domain-containing protein n=1 Tax=Saccharopolyspora sp. NFXS83 TaxID=2993560 RepID=UPI00224B8955|nr:helix-turn-helix transcriptional regulator [Saccharopolyspora sp. NFXS83]MCX2729666.1 helix-turn-helix transcriptional regulator [Saccharopolyspora sp. NFXS83]